MTGLVQYDQYKKYFNEDAQAKSLISNLGHLRV